MTKKDFETAAKYLRETIPNIEERLLLANKFTELFAKTNPAFNRGKFIDAVLDHLPSKMLKG